MSVRPLPLPGIRRAALCVGVGLGLALTLPAQAQDLSYLQGLLANTPEGGWVKASTTTFASAWASPEQGGLPPGTYSDTASVVWAWSSMAWDPNRAQLYLWGGGHASYMGNEMYVWSGQTGAWSRGSLPSRLEFGGNSVFYVVDDAAPQSSHTYDNQLFLPGVDRFISFGGATFNTGGGWQVRDSNGNPSPAGPWIWNPAAADPNKVGGTNGSGYLPEIQGGEMWQNRAPFTTGTRGGSALEGTSAYREENGQDVVYMTRDQNASGWPSLYRYQIGDPTTGALDRWDLVGFGFGASAYQSAAVIDTVNDYYVYLGRNPNNQSHHGLGLWDLNQTSPLSQPWSRFISLVRQDGSAFNTNPLMGMAFDEASGYLLMWDGENRGLVYYTQAAFDLSGNLSNTWTVHEVSSSTVDQPVGDFRYGVLGKWHYVPQLGAFVALDEFQTSNNDAAVWLYKPIVSAVPEPGAFAMMLAGGLVVLWRVRQRRTAQPLGTLC